MRRIWRLIYSWWGVLVLRRRGVRISPLAFVAADCVFEGPNYVDRFCNLQRTVMGRYSYIGYGSAIYGTRIGRFCSIAAGVKCGLGLHPIDQVSTSPLFYSTRNPFGECWGRSDLQVEEFREVEVGHDVWIGTNVLIMGGVRIGNGAVLAAGAVVTKDVPPYAIAGGVPARVLRMRFPDDLIMRLEASKWWEDEPERLRALRNDLADPERFLAARIVVSAEPTEAL